MTAIGTDKTMSMNERQKAIYKNNYPRFLKIARTNKTMSYGNLKGEFARDASMAMAKANYMEKKVLEIFRDYYDNLGTEPKHKTWGVKELIDAINSGASRARRNVTALATLEVIKHELATNWNGGKWMSASDFKTSSGNGSPVHGDLIETTLDGVKYRQEYYVDGNFGEPCVMTAADSKIEVNVNGEWREIAFPDTEKGDKELAELDGKISPKIGKGPFDDISRCEDMLMKDVVKDGTSLATIEAAIKKADFTRTLSGDGDIARRELGYVMENVKESYTSAVRELNREDDSWER